MMISCSYFLYLYGFLLIMFSSKKYSLKQLGIKIDTNISKLLSRFLNSIQSSHI